MTPTWLTFPSFTWGTGFFKTDRTSFTKADTGNKRVVIYTASNGMHAHIIKGLLAQFAIPAYVQGELLQGGIGELPATFDIVKVSVDLEHLSAARSIMQQWDAGDFAQADSSG